jgi:hypothetical protein
MVLNNGSFKRVLRHYQAWTVVFIGLLLFVQCSPASKLRRANKLIALAIAQGAVVTPDTVTQIKYIPGATRIDTVLIEKFIREYRDTTIVKDSIIYRIRIKENRIILEAKCPEQREKIKIVSNTIVAPCSKTFWERLGTGGWLWKLIALGLLVLVVLQQLRKR